MAVGNSGLPPLNPLWSDNALESEADDYLDRGRFVDMVADRINSCLTGQESTVFGLVGPWGSGKSSLISFILAKLGDDWRVATFSPWASGGSNGLQYEFLASLASVLDGRAKNVKRVKDTLVKYAGVCAALLEAIPVVGKGISGAANRSLELAVQGTPWHSQYQKMSEQLRSLGWKVLIVADDIDRLDAEELLVLLKVVRLLGRFPNVHYLLSYDQTTVENLLERKGQVGHSTAFMEKIVQHPYEVPPIPEIIQRRLLSNTINEFLYFRNIIIDDLQGERFSELIAILAPPLKTPRAHIRFREQLMSFAGMLSFEEVDVVDYIGLSFLRMFHHKVYENLPTWQTWLQTGKRWSNSLEPIAMNDDEWTKLIGPQVQNSDDLVLVKKVLSSLFPGISSRSTYARGHSYALSDSTYFQRYFIFGIAEDDIEDQLVKSAIEKILCGSRQEADVEKYVRVLDGKDDQRAALAYEKSIRLRPNGIGDERRLLSFLFVRMPARPDDFSYAASAKAVLWRWVEQEVFSALLSGKITTDVLIEQLSADDALHLAARIIRPDNRRAPSDKLNALRGLAPTYRDLLDNNLRDLLASSLDFNQMIFVLNFLEGDGQLKEFGSRLIAEDDAELLEQVIVKMVVINKWRGTDGITDELAFNSETLFRLFEPAAIRDASERLPSVPPPDQLDVNDASADNKSTFALANLHRIASGVDA
jgi:hypothetical protein